MADEEISCTGTVQRSLCRDGFPKIYQAKHNRNQTPNPRAPLTSNRSGRSSDSLLFRSLPGPCGPVAEMFETSRSFTAAGLSGIHTSIPFSFLSLHKEPETKSAANITVFFRKQKLFPGIFLFAGCFRFGGNTLLLCRHENKTGTHRHSRFRCGIRFLSVRIGSAHFACDPQRTAHRNLAGVDIQLSSFQKSIIITVHDERSGEVVTRVVKIPALPISFERNSDLSALSWDAVDEHLSLTDLRDRYGRVDRQAAYGPDFRPADGRPGECLLLSSVRRGLDGRGHRLHLDARRFFRSAADAGACRESLPGFYPFRLSGFALRLVGIGLRLYGRGGDSHQPALFLFRAFRSSTG